MSNNLYFWYNIGLWRLGNRSGLPERKVQAAGDRVRGVSRDGQPLVVALGDTLSELTECESNRDEPELSE